MSNIEKIKAEIERQRRFIEGLFIEGDNSFYDGQDDAYNHLLAFIDSLPEEKPSEDLEEAADKYSNENEYMDVGFCVEPIYIGHKTEKAFIAGAEWQKEQMMKEWLQDRDGCFWDGVNEGKKAMRDQMIEDAVDGEVWESVHGLRDIVLQTEPFQKVMKGLKEGDKVKIIIVKE